jgi:hypothetical protein
MAQRLRPNPRKIAAYVTQYGAWWSATPAQWKKLAAAGMGLAGNTFQHRGATYAEFDLDALATRISGRPSSIRTSTYESRGHSRRSFSSLVPVIQPLDFNTHDWTYADEEVRRYIATLERA